MTALKKLGETYKRKNDEDDKGQRKLRRSSTNTTEYLRERCPGFRAETSTSGNGEN